MARQLYALHDSDPAIQEREGMRSISNENAVLLNAKGWGIHWAVNKFQGRRQAVRLSKINSWICDIDEGCKESQWERIQGSPLFPSMIVETKNGYHIYFNAKKATIDSWREIAVRLIDFFGGDPIAKDVTRTLRAPGFFHLKDPNDPFLVSIKYQSDVVYTPEDMLFAFPSIPEEPQAKKPERIVVEGDDLTSKLDALDCEYALKRLSGTAYVNGEVYTFQRGSGSNLNIVVNGKSTSCFIDADKRIGATPGGPTIFQWLRYFGHSDQHIYEILKQEFGI